MRTVNRNSTMLALVALLVGLLYAAPASAVWPSNLTGAKFVWKNALTVNTGTLAGDGLVPPEFDYFGAAKAVGRKFVPSPAVMNQTTAFSFEIVVTPANLTQAMGNKHKPLAIFHWGFYWGAGNFWLYQEQDKLWAALPGIGWANPQKFEVATLPDTKPHHVIVTIAKGPPLRLVCYLDGVKVKDIDPPSPADLPISDCPMSLAHITTHDAQGYGPEDEANSWRGTFEYVAMYNRFIEQAEATANAAHVAADFAARPTPPHTYKYGPSGVNPNGNYCNLWVQITEKKAEFRGNFQNGGYYYGTINCAIPDEPGVTNNFDFPVHNDADGNNQRAVGQVSSTQFHIPLSPHSGGQSWILNLESAPPVPATPAITNVAASGVTASSATLNGNLTSAGTKSTTVYVYWGTVDRGQTTSGWDGSQNLGVRSAGAVSHTVSGLAQGATYYYRFYASSSAGEDWADPAASFKTLSAPVVDNGGGAMNVYARGARLRGALTAGGSAAVTIYWGTVDGGNNPSAWQHTNVLGTVSEGAFFSALSGLNPNATYRYRCYAENVVGTDWADATATFKTPEWSPVEATGGAITSADGYTIHTFTSNGTFTTTSGGEVEYLVVGGGGGGGGYGTTGGGGGGGGVLNARANVTDNTTYTITVGAGGAGYTKFGMSEASRTLATSGGNSSIGALVTALGGGHGAGDAQVAGTGNGTVGSGGGGAFHDPGSAAHGVGTPGQGNDGGVGNVQSGSYGGGGGGGAGAVGGNGSTTAGGVGGIGVYVAAFASWGDTGHPGYFGGGGGGSLRNSPGNEGEGGWGGGGKGGDATGVSGQVNTGGGGGAGDYNGGNLVTAGNGGSGIVIIRYLRPALSALKP